MKYAVHMTDRAFQVLESMPETIAFQILSKIDRLAEFPEMGSPLGVRFPKLEGFRQLIHHRSVRVIYDFDIIDETIYILCIQDCRQKLPSPRDIKRASSRRED